MQGGALLCSLLCLLLKEDFLFLEELNGCWLRGRVLLYKLASYTDVHLSQNRVRNDWVCSYVIMAGGNHKILYSSIRVQHVTKVTVRGTDGHLTDWEMLEMLQERLEERK